MQKDPKAIAFRLFKVIGSIAATIVLARVVYATFAFMVGSASWWIDSPTWWEYFSTYTDHLGAIIMSLVGGAFALFLLYNLVNMTGWLVEWVLYGPVKQSEEQPDCTNERCTCVAHRNEVFIDGSWDVQECTDPNCPCKHYHHGESFNVRTQKWE